jgi:hypothetical protein
VPTTAPVPTSAAATRGLVSAKAKAGVVKAATAAIANAVLRMELSPSHCLHTPPENTWRVPAFRGTRKTSYVHRMCIQFGGHVVMFRELRRCDVSKMARPWHDGSMIVGSDAG